MTSNTQVFLTAPRNYGSVAEASKGLLCEVTNYLMSLEVEYIVIGGWCPVLRNQLHNVQHPGTKDVDILFRDAVAADRLHDVVNFFLNAGYLVSAKHDFQLLRVLSVKNRPFVFNLDLLHPSESKNNPDLFVNHFEFDVPEDTTLRKLKIIRSIVLPSSSFLFAGFFTPYAVTGILPDGEHFSGTIPLLDEAGLILSKCESMMLSKRPRDAFDVYLMACQGSRQNTVDRLRDLCKLSPEVHDVLNGCASELKRATRFDTNVKKYWPIPLHASPAQYVGDLLRQSL